MNTETLQCLCCGREAEAHGGLRGLVCACNHGMICHRCYRCATCCQCEAGFLSLRGKLAEARMLEQFFLGYPEDCRRMQKDV